MTDDQHVKITEHDLPQTFILKFLGRSEARGLWGIKHTRDPVNTMINFAKSRDLSLPLVQFKITKEGIYVTPLKAVNESHKCNNNEIIKNEKEKEPPSEVINPETKTPKTKKLQKKAKNNQNGSNDFPRSLKQSILNLKLLKSSKDENLKARSMTDLIIKEKSERLEESYYKSIVQENDKQEKGVCGDDDNDDDLAITKHLNDLDIICKAATMREMKRLATTMELRTDLKLLERLKKIDWGKNGKLFYGIDTISYGVQDLIFTRVFSMIIVSDLDDNDSIHKRSPFTCYAYVCDSRSTARRLTYSLAAAFQVIAGICLAGLKI